MVRAKIAGLRAAQAASLDVAGIASADCREHLRLARKFIDAAGAAVVITHGLSGSGKTVLSQALVGHADALRIRTDVERKRLHAIEPAMPARAAMEPGIYAPDATRRTYRHVLELARHVAAGGYAVVVDGSFLQHWQRDMFRALAAERSLPFLIAAFNARESTLRTRVAARAAAAIDASDAIAGVLDFQMRTLQPFTATELPCVVDYDAEQPLAMAELSDTWTPVLARLGRAPAARPPGPESTR